MKLFLKRTLILFFGVMLVAVGCGILPKNKIGRIQDGSVAASLALSRNEIEEERKIIAIPKKDTIRVKDDDGRELILMNAVQDESGEMVAHDVINAAVITARFRNVAERHGYIDLKFEIVVPKDMQDYNWQLRFHPEMYILEDSTRLESVLVTGDLYRKAQLRGYEQYEKYLQSIINGSFVDERSLKIFIARHVPELYKFATDTSYVSDMEFETAFGVSQREIIDHYTDKWRKGLNDMKRARKDYMFDRYVKVPIQTENIRLDTVMRSINGDFVYNYVQTIKTRPKLRKADIVLWGEIYESDRRLYLMPRTEPLTFYISSMSTLLDPKEKYITKTIYRKAAANTNSYIDFQQGRSNVDVNLGENAKELSRIHKNIFDILGNTKFNVDSIVVVASASPEGAVAKNNSLSAERAASIAAYFKQEVDAYRDSIRREGGFTVSVDDGGRERVGRSKVNVSDIHFNSRSAGENWDMLASLVDRDSTITQEQKQRFLKFFEIHDLDAREAALQKEPYYRYLRESVYPKLRTVRLDFYLSRKNMQKDEIETTELDTVYMKGVQLLRDRDYKEALEYLRDYKDYNTAICYVSLDYNASAMSILQDLEKTPAVNYMLAVLYARNNDDQKAVQHFLDACREDHSYVFRGNLDPEIHILIERYGLNKQNDDDLSDVY